MSFLEKKTFLLVTGASRGLGRAITLALAGQLDLAGSRICIMGREEKMLNETKAQLIAKFGSDAVFPYTIDLIDAAHTDFASIFDEHTKTTFECAIIVHNAGTIGDVSQYARDENDVKVWREYFQTNCFSAIALNCEFMRAFNDVPKLVINVSTLAAIQPIASMGYYCTVKAARDMYFRVLALEEQQKQLPPNQKTLVLSYAPGAVDTAMSLKVQTESHNKVLSESFRVQRETNEMLKPEDSAAKLVVLLRTQNFASGEHVDYHDIKTNAS